MSVLPATKAKQPIEEKDEFEVAFLDLKEKMKASLVKQAESPVGAQPRKIFSYSLGATVNMGNYQSIRIDLGMEEEAVSLEALKAKVRAEFDKAVAEEKKNWLG